jgi:hypothetical protein
MLKTRFRARTFLVIAAVLALCSIAIANYNLQRGGGEVRVEADGKITLAANANKATVVKRGTKAVSLDISNVTDLATRTVTFPNSDTSIPIASQFLTFTGPTAARSYVLPDAATTICGTNSVCTGYQAALTNPAVGVGSGYKIARGVATITGSGTVVTGLTTVVSVTATMQEDFSLTNGVGCSGTIGDQAGSPAAGSVILKVWKPTANNDTTPTASAAAVHVNWIAVGT